jgi:hypothetical protein
MVTGITQYRLGRTGQCCSVCGEMIVIDRIRFGRAAGSCSCRSNWIPSDRNNGTRTDNIISSVCCRKADSNE